MPAEQLSLLDLSDISVKKKDGLDMGAIQPTHPVIIDLLNKLTNNFGVGEYFKDEGLEWLDSDGDETLIAIRVGGSHEQLLVAKYESNEETGIAFVKDKAIVIEAQIADDRNRSEGAGYYQIDLTKLGPEEHEDWITAFLESPYAIESGQLSGIILYSTQELAELRELTKDWWDFKVF